MSTIIGADATKLVGLQIDALTKFREGQLSLVHLERFLNLSPDAREERFGDGKKPKSAPAPKPTVKFDLLADLGFITVPAGYDHATHLATFKQKHQGGETKSFYYYNDDITDEHFPNPSRILKPGDKLYVRAYQQIVSGTTTSEERMAFLQDRKETVFPGAQGASLVFKDKRGQLPKGYWYASFDQKEHLWEDAGGYHRLPYVYAYSDGDFKLYLGRFGLAWNAYSAFFSFRDSE